jgi:hypothetical protein
MDARNSGIMARQAGYPLARCDRLSSRAWPAVVPIISLPPSEAIAYCCCLREGQQKFCRTLFGITQPFPNTFAQFIRMHHAQPQETFDLPGLA